MDRTQYGKVSLADTYRPYDIICKNKPLPGYALLADLQTNLSKVSPHPASPLHRVTPPPQSGIAAPARVSPVGERAETTTTTTTVVRTIPVERIKDQNGDPQEHIYQNEGQRTRSDTYQNGFNHHHHQDAQPTKTGDRTPPTTSSTSIHTYQAYPAKNQNQMFRHETREEVRTETRSSGPNPSPQRSAISNNLSELDSLLHDLNTTKQNSVIKESTVVNGNRPSVDSLLDELNSVGHRESTEKRTTHQETRTTYPPPPAPTSYAPTSYTPKVTHVSASNATKELDDLMESLSDFKGHDTSTTHKEKNVTDVRQRQTQSRGEEYHNLGLLQENAPPRPPSPNETDALPLPPPRPPAPIVSYVSPDISIPAILPAPIIPSPTPATVSIIYTQPDRPQHRPPDALVEDSFIRPESGGPVKRNDAEYRWVTDQIKHEVREIVERPSPPKEVEPKIKVNRINASSLQTQVDTAYAKPIPKRHTSPPPKPAPKPSPPNQLDSMLGSLTSHMTEQGINTSQKGCCCACDKPIVGQVITALGKTWHPEHFVCAHCKEELGTKNFFERDGKPYCEPDYHNLFSPKCAYCSGPILDKCVTAMNKTWHPEHFFCAQCGNTFGEEGFHEKNGKPYCKEDYFNMFAPKCGGCNNPIMENYISALNSQWHPECFVCRDCNQPFNGGSFFDHEGLPYCETHYHAKRGSLCAACNKPITGRCITAMFRKYHPEHFLCAFCLQQLNKGTFKEQNNKPYCHTCFDKLYG